MPNQSDEMFQVKSPTIFQKMRERLHATYMYFLQHPKRKVIFGGVGAGLVTIVAVIVLIVMLRPDQRLYARDRVTMPLYPLVSDVVSVSAPIIVTIPPEFSEDNVTNDISFEPSLRGKWEKGTEEGQYIFSPNRPLRLDSYYDVRLVQGDLKGHKEFLAVEDPAVLAIVPSAGTEIAETDQLTIVFNRPMVALSTRDVLDKNDVPVKISPTIEGTYSWIGTRTLQFTPSERWQRSTHYTVTTEQGFTSLEGLPVAPLPNPHTFTVKPLREENYRFQGPSLPYRIELNQPIDLPETKKHIQLTRYLSEGGSEEKIPVTLEYGTRESYDRVTNKTIAVLDRSILHIYPAKDILGREKRWDYEASYQLLVQDIVPEEGSILLGKPIQDSFSIGSPVANSYVTSQRSNYAMNDFFDPEGEIRISFSDPIDKNLGTVRAPGLSSVSYALICDPLKYIGEVIGCSQVTDQKTLILKFNPAQLAPGQEFNVVLDKIVHKSGYQLNRQEVSLPFRVVPPLKVTKFELDKVEPLQFAHLCSTTPITTPDKKKFYTEVLTSNVPIYFRNWNYSYSINDENDKNPCELNEFYTYVHWGLQPETDFKINLHLSNDFGGITDFAWEEKTGSLKKANKRLRSMQDFYTTTTPARTKLTYVSENYQEVEVAICKMSGETMIRLLYSEERIPKPADCETIAHETIDMPDTYWANMFLQVDIKKHFPAGLGHYAILLGEKDRGGFGTTANQVGFITVSDLVVTEKRIPLTSTNNQSLPKEVLMKGTVPGNLYWIVRAGSLVAVPNAKVTNYRFNRNERGELVSVNTGTTKTSGQDGIAIVPFGEEVEAALVTSGADSAIVTNEDMLQWGGYSQTDERGYIYTDRPIYRPQHEVFFKGIIREQFDAVYRQVPGLKEIPVKITDSMGVIVYEQKLPLSQFGTFNSSWILPANSALGSYSIETPYGYGYFEVEEFVGAPFKAEVLADKKEYVSGENASIVFDAEYFFGAPVPNVTVEYSITAQDYFFDHPEVSGVSFEGGWYTCYECDVSDRQIAHRTLTLPASGRTSIVESLSLARFFEKEEDRRSKIFVVHATMKDSNGRSVSTQQSFIVHAASVYVGVATDPYYTVTNQPVTVKVATVAKDGTLVAHSGVEVIAEKLSWQSFERQAVDGRFYEQWEQVAEVVERRLVATGAGGSGTTSMTFTTPGEYKIRALVRDSAGRANNSETYLYVGGSDAAGIRPQEGHSLDISAIQKSRNIGEVADVIIKSPFASGKALLTVERGRIFSYSVVPIEGNILRYPVAITEEHAPNISVSAVVLSPEPQVKSGRAFIDVNRDLYGLTVELTTNKEAYLPGEEVVVNALVRDAKGAPVAAELSLAAVDMSVLALKGNPKKDPLEFFFRRLPFFVFTSNTARHILEEIDISENTGKKSGDGGTAEDLARKKRGIFKETAFWKADLVTTMDGHASARFKLPDNLTTWQLEGLAVTADTRVGVGYQDFLETKDVLVQPLVPRFVLAEDHVSLGAIVTNQTGGTQNLSVAIASESLPLPTPAKQWISLPPKSQKSVYFDVVIPDDETIDSYTFTLSAANPSFEDTVELTLPVHERRIEETTALSNMSASAIEREYLFIPEIAKEGTLKVRASATLAVYVSDALNSLISFPYGCSEQIVSRIGALATVSRALDVKNIKDEDGILETIEFRGTKYSVRDAIQEGLKRIYENQNDDGGIGYYNNMSSNYYLTLHVLDMLHEVEKAGFKVDSDAMKRMSDFIGEELARNTNDQRTTDTDGLINGLRVLAEGPHKPANYRALLRMVRKNVTQKFAYEEASTLTLNNLAILGAHTDTFRKMTNLALKALENRMAIDARGAYIEEGKNVLWDNYETDIQNTALYIKNVTLHDLESPFRDELLRWILVNKTPKYAWGSTHNDVTVLSALTDYLVKTGENKSEYNAELSLDGVNVHSWSVTNDTILEEIIWETSLDRLPSMKNIVVEFAKDDQNRGTNTIYYDMAMEYSLPVKDAKARDEGVYIERKLVKSSAPETPLSTVKVGDIVRGELTMIVPKDRRMFAIEDKIPAGFEIVNFNLTTEDSAFIEDENEMYERQGGKQMLYPDHSEMRDDRVFAFQEFLPAGTYTYEYYLRATVPGVYQHLPARAYDFYFPENFGRTKGSIITVTR